MERDPSTPPDAHTPASDASDASAVVDIVEAPSHGFTPRPNVTVMQRGDKTWYIIGTAHVSDESVQEVQDVIREVQPDTVAIELCETRYASLTDENRWEKLNIFEVIKEGKTLMLIANLAIGAYQRRIGAQLGVKPGAEMIEAAKLAEAVGAEVFLADRDIQTTLKRTWRNVGFFKRAGLLGAIVESLLGGKGDIDAEEIERMKESEQLSAMLEEFAKAMPEVKGPLIDERDLYMVSKLHDAPGNTIVAVVGAGHVPGMTKHFDDAIDRTALEVIPPPPAWTDALKWIIPAFVIGAFYFGYRQQGGQTLQDLVYAWILPNVFFAALFTAIAGAKIPTIVVAGIASPITSLNPLLPVGVPVGFCEAWLRKPTVADAERIADDVQSLKGFYKNAFTRTLLVVMASIFGSASGAWIGVGWMLTLFGKGG